MTALASTTIPLKRKAEADAQPVSLPPSKPAPSPELQPASRDQHAPLDDALRHPRFSAPEARSLLAIVRENHRRRLYLPPLLWTAEQVELLECRFLAKKMPRHKKSDKPLPPEVLPEDGRELPKSPVTARDYAIQAAISLSGLGVVNARISAVIDLLAPFNFKYAPTSLSFFFDRNRYVTCLRAATLFASESAPPSLAYINLDRLHPLRIEYYREKFRPCFHDKRRARYNDPVSRLMWKKLGKLKPENELEDPYIVAVLIALAQIAARSTPVSESAESQHGDPAASEQMPSLPKAFKVHVLAMPYTATRKIYLYTACFPATFLDKLDQPSRFSPCEPVTIAYYALPLRHPMLLQGLALALRAPVE